MTMPTTQPGDPGQSGVDQEQSGGGTRQQIREVRDQVVDQAKTSLRQAKDRATSSLGESRDRFAEQIGALAEAFRRTGEHLRSEDQQRVAGLTESMARQAERAADYLRTFDPRTARDDLEDLARRQPALVMGGAFALGLLGARFFKSSRRRGGDGQVRSAGYQGRERRRSYPGYRGSQEPVAVGRMGTETNTAGGSDAWS